MPALDCAEELTLVEKGLAPLQGVGEVRADYLNRRLLVDYDPRQLAPPLIAARVREIGFKIESLERIAAAPRPGVVFANLWGVALGGVLLGAAAIVSWTTGETNLAVIVLTVVATITSGWRVAWAGWRAVRLWALDMNALMTIAAVGAIATGEYFEAATAMLLFGVALWLESFSLNRARRAVQSLLEWAPTVAHRLEAAGPRDVDPAELLVDDLLLVKPGERIPVDGQVLQGASSVNQAPITGESLPVDKAAGDDVFAGTLNGEGSLEIRATRTAGESTLAHIARLVEQAQSDRAPTQRFVDAFARRYTPAVIVLAVLLATLPPLLWQAPWLDWLHRGLVLLVIACPCALVISTPMTIVCGLHRAARRGMLIKGGEHLENAGRIDCIAFDKTGTLTTGVPRVARIAASAGHKEQDVLRVAAALESQSEHPLAKAVVEAAIDSGVAVEPARDVTALRGFGVQGTIDGQTYYVGNLRLFREQRLAGFDVKTTPSFVTALLDTPASLALVGTREAIIGAVLLSDQLREDAVAAIAELKELGVRPLVMLTGDNWNLAEHLAAELGLDEVRAELLPQDKVSQMIDLTLDRPYVAMVGDGVNDAPALAAARLGIALGSEASDTALETADVAILSPRLSRVPELLRLGRRCRALLAQNIALSLAIKGAVLLLAAAGLATMWMAVAADVGASMLVILNGMRLLNGSK